MSSAARRSRSLAALETPALASNRLATGQPGARKAAAAGRSDGPSAGFLQRLHRAALGDLLEGEVDVDIEPIRVPPRRHDAPQCRSVSPSTVTSSTARADASRVHALAQPRRSPPPEERFTFLQRRPGAVMGPADAYAWRREQSRAAQALRVTRESPPGVVRASSSPPTRLTERDVEPRPPLKSVKEWKSELQAERQGRGKWSKDPVLVLHRFHGNSTGPEDSNEEAGNRTEAANESGSEVGHGLWSPMRGVETVDLLAADPALYMRHDELALQKMARRSLLETNVLETLANGGPSQPPPPKPKRAVQRSSARSPPSRLPPVEAQTQVSDGLRTPKGRTRRTQTQSRHLARPYTSSCPSDGDFTSELSSDGTWSRCRGCGQPYDSSRHSWPLDTYNAAPHLQPKASSAQGRHSRHRCHRCSQPQSLPPPTSSPNTNSPPLYLQPTSPEWLQSRLLELDRLKQEISLAISPSLTPTGSSPLTGQPPVSPLRPEATPLGPAGCSPITPHSDPASITSTSSPHVDGQKATPPDAPASGIPRFLREALPDLKMLVEFVDVLRGGPGNQNSSSSNNPHTEAWGRSPYAFSYPYYPPMPPPFTDPYLAAALAAAHHPHYPTPGQYGPYHPAGPPYAYPPPPGYPYATPPGAVPPGYPFPPPPVSQPAAPPPPAEPPHPAAAPPAPPPAAPATEDRPAAPPPPALSPAEPVVSGPPPLPPAELPAQLASTAPTAATASTPTPTQVPPPPPPAELPTQVATPPAAAPASNLPPAPVLPPPPPAELPTQLASTAPTSPPASTPTTAPVPERPSPTALAVEPVSPAPALAPSHTPPAVPIPAPTPSLAPPAPTPAPQPPQDNAHSSTAPAGQALAQPDPLTPDNTPQPSLPPSPPLPPQSEPPSPPLPPRSESEDAYSVAASSPVGPTPPPSIPIPAGHGPATVPTVAAPVAEADLHVVTVVTPQASFSAEPPPDTPVSLQRHPPPLVVVHPADNVTGGRQPERPPPPPPPMPREDPVPAAPEKPSDPAVHRSTSIPVHLPTHTPGRRWSATSAGSGAGDDRPLAAARPPAPTPAPPPLSPREPRPVQVVPIDRGRAPPRTALPLASNPRLPLGAPEPTAPVAVVPAVSRLQVPKVVPRPPLSKPKAPVPPKPYLVRRSQTVPVPRPPPATVKPRVLPPRPAPVSVPRPTGRATGPPTALTPTAASASAAPPMISLEAATPPSGTAPTERPFRLPGLSTPPTGPPAMDPAQRYDGRVPCSTCAKRFHPLALPRHVLSCGRPASAAAAPRAPAQGRRPLSHTTVVRRATSAPPKGPTPRKIYPAVVLPPGYF